MAFALTWPTEYVGSFPVDSVQSATQKVSDRLSQLRNAVTVRNVLLSVSIAGVKISSSDNELVYMAHALKRISYATCDADYCQVAFVAREPSVKNENADPSAMQQRLCHVFRTDCYDTADEINCVLGNAFRAAYLHKVGERRRRRSVEKAREKQASGSSGGDSALSSTSSGEGASIDLDDNKRLGGSGSVQSRLTSSGSSTPPPPPPSRPAVAMPRPLYDNDGFVRPAAPRAVRPHSVMVTGSPGFPRQSDFATPHDLDAITSCSTTPTSSSDLSRSSKRSSSSALLRRLFGGKEKQSPSPEAVVMRPPTENKKRRRPVSAVFSHALSRITSSTSAMSPSPRAGNKSLSASIGKRMSRIELPTIYDPLRQFDNLEQSRRSHSVGNVHRVLATKPSDIGVGRSPGVGCNDRCRPVDQLTMSPVYNSQTSEWLMPIDLEVERVLNMVPWYSGDTDRDFIVKVLRSQPEGAFVVRKSLSHRCCLALSVRVPETHNPVAVSHYLILHVKDGFKLKGFHKAFPSVQTLVTHHSVMQEQLPCRLVFVNWDYRVWTQPQHNSANRDYDTPACEAVYGSFDLPVKAV